MKRSPIKLTWFLILQLVVVGSLAAAMVYRYDQRRSPPPIPPLRPVPLSVTPQYDYPFVVSDDQLRDVLRRLRPQFHGNRTRINNIDHALRFWTAAAEFTSGVTKPLATLTDAELAQYNDESYRDAAEHLKYLSGRDMVQLLTDARLLARVQPLAPKSLLSDTDSGGTRVEVAMEPWASSHVDHTMACLAETGTPLGARLITPTRPTSYESIVRQSIRDFSLNQQEYEWSALTFALFMPPHRSWITSEGQQVDFDLLARRIMRQTMPQGVCFGNHRLFTLVILLRVDDQHPILSPAVRAETMDYLAGMTTTLESTQHPAGFWNGSWPDATPETEPSESDGDRLTDRLLATGHALEWWALAPKELHPSDETLQRAGQWLARQLTDELTDRQIQSYYPFLTHAGNALTLWRGKRPPQVDLDPTRP